MKNRLRITLLLLLVCAMLVGVVHVAAEDVATGFEFEPLVTYRSVGKEITLPATFEATVCLPKDFSERGGVIIGNYSGNDTPEVNFEVYTNGKPRICINNVEGVDYDVVFGNVDVRTGEPVHIAITVDHDNERWTCYMNGVLMQTISREAPAPFKFKTKIALGGDLRAGNKQYFKGSILDVALYSDVRSAKEIAADFKGDALDTDNIICAYDLSDIPAGSTPKNIPCQVDSGFSIFCRTEWITELDEPKNYAYSFAVIGDIQNLTCYYPDQLNNLYKWIRDNAEEKKIKFAIGLGDVTDTNTTSEYVRVNRAYDYINGVVPFSIIRGNHDREGLFSAQFDKYITKDRYGDEITGSYDDTMKNTYRILKVGRVEYLFMNLDYLLKDEVLDWANDIISEHPECHVIVSTHIYMSSNSYYVSTNSGSPYAKYGCENTADGLWEKVLSKHENIVMLLCGHDPTDDICYRQRTGDNGNVVTEILVDPQDTDLSHGGVGLVAMFYFSEDGSQLEVQYYSTVNDAFFKKNNQFKLTLDVPEIEADTSTETETIEETEPLPPETEAPSTEAPANSGCGLFLAVNGLALVILLGTCTVFVSKKRL